MRHSTALADRIDACLPQTQCTLCGFPRCRDYAEAIAEGSAAINRCAPGDSATINALAQVCSVEAMPLDPNHDLHPGRQVAHVREHDCIGCALCLQPCPVDAIIGAAKQMHVVIQSECTGCRLCVPACPVDCIEMIDCQPPQPGKMWAEFTDVEVLRFRNLAERKVERVREIDRLDHSGVSERELKDEIREAVNRGRRKRWRKYRKARAVEDVRTR